jgi:electron transport complex protein RnfE
MTVLGTYFSLNQLMGIYLALTIFTIPQLRLETVEDKSILDHGFMILVGFVALVLIGFLREFLGTGSIGLLAFGLDTVQVFDAKFGIAILKDNSGGFILAGFIFAIINAIPFVKEDKADVI